MSDSTVLNETAKAAVVAAMLTGELADVEWKHGDDRCECLFQKVAMWKNIYLAVTEEIRLCCLYNELKLVYPNLFQTLPGYHDDNTGEWHTTPREWDGEDDMPAALWHRQIAVTHGISVDQARYRMEGFEPPKGTPREAEDAGSSISEALMNAVLNLATRMNAIENRVGA